MRPTSIAHITNLDHDCIINLSASLVMKLLVLLLHLFNRLFWLHTGRLIILTLLLFLLLIIVIFQFI